jgi:cytochrome c-type biogenesis protein CcmH/NrfG
VRARLTYFTLAAVLLVYFVLVGGRGVVLLRQGTPVTVGLGLAVLVMPVIGLWFLWHTTRFARSADRLARELEAEGGLPVDDLKRTPAGRIEQVSADAAFAARKAEAEQEPGDWRNWFRLAVAYHDARDTPRARKAMQRAITLHDGGEPREV